MLQLRAIDELSAERAAGSVAERLQVDFLKLKSCICKTKKIVFCFCFCVLPSDLFFLHFRSGFSDHPPTQEIPQSIPGAPQNERLMLTSCLGRPSMRGSVSRSFMCQIGQPNRDLADFRASFSRTYIRTHEAIRYDGPRNIRNRESRRAPK